MKKTTCLQVRSRQIIVYDKFDRSFSLRSAAQQEASKKLTEQETYTGRLCPGAKKRLTKAIELLTQVAFKNKQFLYQSKKTGKDVRGSFKLNFITLTIHNPNKMIEGKEGHSRCLEPMLKWLRDHYGLSLYIWKAELQANRQDCKQLHYHITSDCFVPWEKLWYKWGQLNEKAGYLNDWFATQPRTKLDKKGREVINYPTAGTDVHSAYKVSDMNSYLRKCICATKRRKDGSIVAEYAKDIQNAASVGGKVWDCSENLKNGEIAKLYTIEGSLERSFSEYNHQPLVEDQWLADILFDVMAEAKKPGNKFAVTDHCTIYEFTRPPVELLPDFFYDDYYHSMELILNYKRPKRLSKYKKNDFKPT